MLKTGMQIHGRLVPESLRPLHESLETEFKKMKKTVTELVRILSVSFLRKKKKQQHKK
jgi:hypothetical protein